MTYTAHMIGGSWFILYGGWWLFLTCWAELNTGYWQKLAKHFQRGGSGSICHGYKITPETVSWIPQPVWPKIPLESVMKIVFGLAGLVIEIFFDDILGKDGHSHVIFKLYNVFTPDGKLGKLNKFQHCALYTPYILSGIIDLLSLHTTLPPRTSQLFFSMSFWIGAILLFFHKGCNSELHIYMHIFWMLVTVASAIFALLRMINGKHLTPNIGLSSSLLITGTWIIQIAYTIYPPSGKRWIDVGPVSCDVDKSVVTSDLSMTINATTVVDSPDRHNQAMFTSLAFAFHLMGVLVFVLSFWLVLRLFLRKHACDCCKCCGRVVPQKLQQKLEAMTEESGSEESLIDEQRAAYQKATVDSCNDELV